MNLTSVSFVIPMYNESKSIRKTVESLTKIAKRLSDNYEIIIANDGSTDNSGDIIDEIARNDAHVKPVHLSKNTKFGGAFAKGIKKASKEIIIYTDSDLPIKSSDVDSALLLLEKGDIVNAYSTIKKGETLKRVIMSKVYNFLIQLFFRANIKDINSGFKIYKTKIFEDMELKSKSPFIDVEIFIKAIRKGAVIKQYPIVFRQRDEGKSYISRPAVILKTLIDMMVFNLTPYKK